MDSRRFEVVFLVSGLWSENAALFKRLMKIHSNPPILSFGYLKVHICGVVGLQRVFFLFKGLWSVPVCICNLAGYLL